MILEELERLCKGIEQDIWHGKLFDRWCIEIIPERRENRPLFYTRYTSEPVYTDACTGAFILRTRQALPQLLRIARAAQALMEVSEANLDTTEAIQYLIKQIKEDK